jgi:hypothetical protein
MRGVDPCSVVWITERMVPFGGAQLAPMSREIRSVPGLCNPPPSPTVILNRPVCQHAWFLQLSPPLR